MDYQYKIGKIMEEYNGFLLTDAVTKADIPRVYIKEFLDKGEIIKVERGIYLKKDAQDDLLFRTQLKYKGIMYSHETALRLHGLLKNCKKPVVTATVKTGINPTKLKSRGLKIYTLKENLLQVGAINLKTEQGNEVRTYNLERTICDMIRSRNSIDDAVFGTALNEYIRGEYYNEDALEEMARIFHVDKLLKNFKKVIL